MGQTIWSVLAEFEGRWVAVDGAGRVVAHEASLPELIRAANGAARRLTFLYAAPAAAVRS
ncbi:MAG: hypothetical protein ACHQ49_09840 [Elusimicrobiota bacterium]